MWIEVVFVIVLAVTALLSARMRNERIERLRWRDFKADAPMDLTGLEQFDPRRYSATGRKLFPVFLASALATMALFFIVFWRFAS